MCNLGGCSSSQQVSLLRQGGKAAFVHRPGRLMDIVTLNESNIGLEPKRIQFVYPKAGKEANTILIEGIKDGKPRFENFTSAYVYNDKNEYTS